MDTIAHALAGALIARATAPAQSDGVSLRNRMAAGFVAAAFPDSDLVLTWISPLAYVMNHRGATHSLLLLPVWAWLLAWLFARMTRGRPGWRAYFSACVFGIGSHIVFDIVTAFGTMALWPLSDARFALSITYIIDLYFSGILLAGLAACALWRSSRVPAAAALALLAGYLGLQGLLQNKAIGIGDDYARAHGLGRSEVSAQARPVSPFNWMVVVAEDERFHYAFVSLSRDYPPPAAREDGGFIERLSSAYYPPPNAVWTRAERFGTDPADIALAKQAWQQPAFVFFRWFAEYPVLLRIDRGNPSTCVWFRDLRFLTPGRNAWPFRYGLCRDNAREWIPYELIGDGGRRALR